MTECIFILCSLAKKIVGENSVYLATFGGSSVTAGHDNKFEQSYPIVFERRVSAAMEAVGIQVSVHNIAHYVFNIGIITIQ